MKSIIKSRYIALIFCVLASLFLGCKETLNSDYGVGLNKESDCKELLRLCKDALINNDTIQFNSLSKEASILALKLKDSLALAEVNWNYGTYYSSRKTYNKSLSYLSKAHTIYSALGNESNLAKVLYDEAGLKRNVKDYLGAEAVAIKALRIFKDLNDNLNEYKCYYFLAQINRHLKEYDIAISYHKKALAVVGENDFPDFKLEKSYNSIGVLYKDKKDYVSAVTYFKKGLTERVVNKSPELYSSLLINLAHIRLLKKDTLGLYAEMDKAIKIKEGLNYQSGLSVSYFYLSDYYLYKKDTLKAIKILEKSVNLLKTSNYNEFYLKGLKQLSKLDLPERANYLEKYLVLSDSLHLVERKQNNKFARIRFETDEYAAKSKELSKENKNLTIFVIVGSLLFTLIFFLKQQFNRNKALVFDRGQQLANQEIFTLLLHQQSKLEEGKKVERTRISEDLHDGVLSRMFGTRLSLGFLLPKLDESAHKDFIELTESLHDIEKEIRSISHDLKKDVFTSSFSFVSVITSMMKDDEEIGGFTIDFTMDDTILWGEVSDLIKVNIYRMLQESLLNIIKYAKAENVKVDFKLIDGFITIYITDDGVGFDVKRSKKGIGHKNMSSRVAKLNGSFSLKSNEGAGTTVFISIPINSELDS